QVVVSGTSKRGTPFKLETWQERAARAGSTEEPLGEEKVQVVEDIMAVVQVVVEEKGDIGWQVEQQTQPGPGPSMPQSATDSLKVLHLDLGSVNAPGCMACPWLRWKLWQRHLPCLEGTWVISQGIFGFWTRAISLYWEPSSALTMMETTPYSLCLCPEASDQKHEVLNSCKVAGCFLHNLYFHSKVIFKAYYVGILVREGGHSGCLTWWVSCPDYRAHDHKSKNHHSSLKFRSWLIDNTTFLASAGFSKILCKDLWRNPLQYYRRMKPPEEETEISGEPYSWN
uniref:Uncharacterized protein n=1 Tax=Chlorocebus sabaeus TaxID=60711 RepID=A0A0D9S0C9_CHLSB